MKTMKKRRTYRCSHLRGSHNKLYVFSSVLSRRLSVSTLYMVPRWVLRRVVRYVVFFIIYEILLKINWHLAIYPVLKHHMTLYHMYTNVSIILSGCLWKQKFYFLNYLITFLCTKINFYVFLIFTKIYRFKDKDYF